MASQVKTSQIEYPAWPIASLGAAVIEGDPTGTGQVTFQTSDNLVSGGVWACSRGIFDLTYGWDEMAYLLEGEVTIEEASGSTIEGKAGDLLFFPKGSQTRWNVKQPVRKVFFLRSAEPIR